MKCIDKSSVSMPQKLCDAPEKTKLYENLRYGDGKIRDRWNTIQKDNRKVVRETLSSTSNEECSYCGKKIIGSDMDVDHFLPSAVFPYLSYCWDNMLPSCKRCNQALKNDYSPPALKEKIIIEHCAQNLVNPYDFTFNKNIMYALAKDERLIDPTFDNVDEHLEFNPEFYLFKAKSPIGEKTIEIFFDNVDTMRQFEKISIIVKEFVKLGLSRDVITPLIEAYGTEFYYNAFWDYWTIEKSEGRLV